ncbi:MAG: alpha-1,2-fucosyltransferase [Steroidobacteraceae bacterium]
MQIIRQAPERSLFPQQLRVQPGMRSVYLEGFWQDASMVREVETELRRELSFVDPPRGRNLETANRITAAHNPVSMHLRRRDYGSCSGDDMILPTAYYEHAIAHMLECNRRSSFFVFTDDITFARDWLRGDPRFVVVDHNNNEQSVHENLRLMSLCRHHIIANSSFSWWGAWFNPRRDKQVIAPARWLGFDTSMTAIAYPDWTLLDAEMPRRMPLAVGA